jgi:hypothetical protein
MSPKLDPIIERFRFSHHNVAMMFAMGMTVQEISRKTGFTQRRLIILLDDPTFNELIDHYRNQHRNRMLQALPNAIEDMDFVRVATVRKMREAIEESDETGEPISVPNLVRMHGEMADRTGYSKHTLKTVVNVSFAESLDRAIERSGKGPELKLIEGGVLSTVPSPPTPKSVGLIPLPRQTFRRA